MRSTHKHAVPVIVYTWKYSAFTNEWCSYFLLTFETAPFICKHSVYRHPLDKVLRDIPGTHSLKQIWKPGSLETALPMPGVLLFFILRTLLWASSVVFFVAGKGQGMPQLSRHNYGFFE